MASFKVGDLIWAKMRGFPHWPAQISKGPTQVNPKYNVFFFGTHESAFVKLSDICSYTENLSTYGVARKLNGFQKALDEIMEAAKKKAGRKSLKKETPTQPLRQQRNRIPNRLISSQEFVVPQPKKLKLDKSDMTSPSQPGSPRKRTDSNSSTERSRKRISYSERFGVDLSDIETTYPHALKNNALANLGLPPFESQESEHSDDDFKFGGGRKRRRTRSKMFDDFLLYSKTSRDRSGSFSSNNGRTRFISGFSDTFEDLEHFNPNELMAAIDDLPSDESDRPTTPEAPTTMPLSEKRCYVCKCPCEVFKRKWRCSNRECHRWNGVVEAQPFKPNPIAHPLSFNFDRQYLDDIPVSDSSDKGGDPLKKLAGVASTAAVPAEPQAVDQITKIKHELMTEVEEPKTPLLSAAAMPEEVQLAAVVDPVVPVVPVSSTPLPPSLPMLSPKREVKDGTLGLPLKTPVPPAPVTMPIRTVGVPGVRLEHYEAHKRPSRPGTRSRAKVEKTPPVNSNGVRYCYFCPGQVRPQMCGGNKHRWRCVDKKCRKWYGWVKSSDEIPRDLGKKGRWKDLVIRVQSSQNEFEDRLASDMIQKNAEENCTEEERRAKRRYRRCKPQPCRDISPLSVKESYYEPSCMEQRPRWWIQERKKADFSPEREFGTDILDAAASLRLIANSMLTAANTKTDEYGSVNGALDLLMDSLMASLAPLLSIAKHIPHLDLPEETLQKLWSSSSLHTPMF